MKLEARTPVATLRTTNRAAPLPLSLTRPQAVLSDTDSGIQLSGSERTADASDGSLRAQIQIQSCGHHAIPELTQLYSRSTYRAFPMYQSCVG